MCFVIDLLKRVLVSLNISLFMGFHVGSSNGKVIFDIIIISNYIRHQYVADLKS